MLLLIALLPIFSLYSAAPSLSLQQDLLDFVELIPLEDLKIVFDKHIRNDPEFQAAVKYIQGSEWQKLEEAFVDSKEVKNVKDYLLKAGIDIDLVSDFMNEFVQGIQIKTHNKRPSIKKFLDDISALIPHDKLAELLADKMENSVYFQEFYDKLSSERLHKMTEKVLALPEAQEILEKARMMEAPVDVFIRSIYTFLGWPTTNLNSFNIK